MIPEFLYPFLVYRSFVIPILVLTALVVPCWVIVRLYRLRTSGHRLSFQRELLLLSFVVYLSGLAAVTVMPTGSSRVRAATGAGLDLRPSRASLTCSSASMPMGSTARSFCVRNARGNVLLFLPLGILIPLIWRRLHFWGGIQIAMAVSLAIELAQYLSGPWVSHRAADVNDLVLNVFGAALGLTLVFLLRRRPGTRLLIPRA